MPEKVIDKTRWEKAQDFEKVYWQSVSMDPVEFLRILHEKYDFISHLNKYCPQCLIPPTNSQREALEIGIGALGIGVLSLIDITPPWKLIGVDPIERIDHPNLPDNLKLLYRDLIKKLFEYVQTPAEKLPFESNRFELVACYNVLDHTHNPGEIIREIFRVLKDGGYFLLGLDALSFANWLRHKLFIEDIYHPYKYTTWHVEKLLPAYGFEVVCFSKSPYELLVRLTGKARRIIAVGRKPITCRVG